MKHQRSLSYFSRAAWLMRQALSAWFVFISAALFLTYAPHTSAQKLPDPLPSSQPRVTLPADSTIKPASPSPSSAGKTLGGSVAIHCGSSSGGMFPSPPLSNLCAAGSVVIVPAAALGATQYQWTCGSAGPAAVINGVPLVIAPSVCTANKKYNGQCGSANGVVSTAAPTANLCALGTATTPTLTGSNYTWSCTGVLPATGATVASCSAPAPAPSIVQAVSETVSSTAGTQGSVNVRANDTAPPGSVYSLAAGSTCSPVSVSALGVVSYTAPAAGQSCVVNYTVCNSGQCSTGTLTVTGTAPPVPTYTIGVNVSGLPSGSNVVLQNNGGNNLTLAANGAATFSTAVSGAYAVTVLTQPTAANCVVTGGTGTASANVNSISVACTAGRFSLVPKASGGFYDVTECVKDNVTGLIWEGKTAGGARAFNNIYTNFDDPTRGQIANNVGGTWIITNPTTTQISAATNSIGYKNTTNSTTLCGYSDWRLPSKNEVHYLSTSIASADFNQWFQGQASWMWTSDIFLAGSHPGVVAKFPAGGSFGQGRKDWLNVRLVRQ